MKTYTSSDEFEHRIKELVLDLFKEYPNVFLTGSREFGGSHSESDYDICIHIESKNSIFEMLKKLGTSYTISEYNNSIKVYGVKLTDPNTGLFRFVTINPIPLHPNDMLYWWFATRQLSRLSKRGIYENNKTSRHGIFEQLKGFYKNMISKANTKDLLDKEQADYMKGIQ